MTFLFMIKQQKLVALHQKIKQCQKCSLHKTAFQAVPGEGDVDARIMFIGEAPGRHEDESGRPFVGRAGKLLTQLIESIGIRREDVFITSVVKHRPPKNRAPKSVELKTCKHWLDEQLAIIQPKIIVPLGRFGMKYFLPDIAISQAHGKVFPQKDWWVFPVYHPAYGLRGTRALNALKDDFQALKRVILKRDIKIQGY